MLSTLFEEILNNLSNYSVVSVFMTAIIAFIPGIFAAISKQAARKLSKEKEKAIYETLKSQLKDNKIDQAETLTREQYEKIVQQFREAHTRTDAQAQSLAQVQFHAHAQAQAKAKAVFLAELAPLRYKEEAVGITKRVGFLNHIIAKRDDLITAVSSLVEITLSLDSLKDASKAKTNTIVGMMLKEKLDGSNKSCLLIIVALVVYSLIAMFNLIPLHFSAFAISLGLLGAIYLDQYLIVYRVKKGWYGRNEYEAREIINYIIAHANPEDFNDEGGLKTLMAKSERKQLNEADDKGWVKA